MWLAADFLLCPSNIGGLEPAPTTALLLVLAMAALAAMLVLQDRFGPRFFLGETVRFNAVYACTDAFAHACKARSTLAVWAVWAGCVAD